MGSSSMNPDDYLLPLIIILGLFSMGGLAYWYSGRPKNTDDDDDNDFDY